VVHTAAEPPNHGRNLLCDDRLNQERRKEERKIVAAYGMLASSGKRIPDYGF